MAVSLAAQALSGSMASAVEPVNPALGAYCRKANVMLGIFNQKRSRRGAVIPKIAAPDGASLVELLSILAFFRGWRAQVYGAVSMTSLNYLHQKTHCDLTLGILGFVGMCQWYLAPGRHGHGHCVDQKRVSQDILEHHFRNIRGSGRDNTTPTVRACAAATRHSSIIRLLRGSKGNGRNAPLLEEDAFLPRARREVMH